MKMLKRIPLEDHAAHEQMIRDCGQDRVRSRELRATSVLIRAELHRGVAEARALRQQRQLQLGLRWRRVTVPS